MILKRDPPKAGAVVTREAEGLVVYEVTVRKVGKLRQVGKVYATPGGAMFTRLQDAADKACEEAIIHVCGGRR